MKDRIKLLRKTLELTQQNFAARLGVKGNTISQYESGRNAPVDSVISLICREFSVNETWLRTGEGEMFLEKSDSVLETLAERYGLSNEARALVEGFINLKPDIQQVLVDYALKVAESYQDPAEPEPATTEEKIAALERQNRELAARLEAMEKEEDALEAEERAARSRSR